MKQKRKNKFFTFIFSFLPGAAEMYMGFMKNGVTLMGLFFLSFMPAMFFSTMDFIAVLGVIIWFFSFFHARNYAGMTDEEFYSMQDKFIWDEYLDEGTIRFTNKHAKTIVAAVLIIVGLGQLWNYFSDVIYSMIPDAYWDSYYRIFVRIPQVIVSVLFVVAGVLMIKGKKKAIEATPDVEVKRIADIAQAQEVHQTQETAPETKEA